jgi:hypothetical protein
VCALEGILLFLRHDGSLSLIFINGPTPMQGSCAYDRFFLKRR